MYSSMLTIHNIRENVNLVIECCGGEAMKKQLNRWKIWLLAGMGLLLFTGCKKSAPPAEENRGGAFVTGLPELKERTGEKDAQDLMRASELDGIRRGETIDKDALKNALKKEEPSVTPEAETITPTKPPEKKESGILGEYKTYYGDSSASRSTNIETAARKIDGTVLQPGEEFSCHDSLAPFTSKNGYKAAGAFEQGKIVESVGGGVCQVSTTLYNAVLLAELKVTSRAAHSMTVGYVELSRDAAIAGDYKDLKFVNNLETPVTIQASTDGGWLSFRIEGKDTRKPERTIRFETVVLSKQEPGEDIVTVDENQASDYSKVTQKAHIGYKTELYKIISIDGKETDRILINRSSYEPSPQYVTVGKAKDSEN